MRPTEILCHAPLFRTAILASPLFMSFLRPWLVYFFIRVHGTIVNKSFGFLRVIHVSIASSPGSLPLRLLPLYLLIFYHITSTYCTQFRPPTIMTFPSLQITKRSANRYRPGRRIPRIRLRVRWESGTENQAHYDAPVKLTGTKRTVSFITDCDPLPYKMLPSMTKAYTWGFKQS